MSKKELTNYDKIQILSIIINDQKFLKETYPEDAVKTLIYRYDFTEKQTDKIIVKCIKLLRNLTK